jgi:hypothetical protein
MENWIFGVVFIWLAVISWFDLKKREIPNSAWVIVPFGIAMVYQALVGDWQLTFLSCVIAIASERERLAKITGYISIQSFSGFPGSCWPAGCWERQPNWNCRNRHILAGLGTALLGRRRCSGIHRSRPDLAGYETHSGAAGCPCFGSVGVHNC